jgi:hypothetical protein
MTHDPIQHLRELLAKATPGPLHMTKLQEGAVIRARSDWLATYGEERDAALIVAAIRALPALLDVAEAARAKVACLESLKYCNDEDVADHVVDDESADAAIVAAIAKLDEVKI